MPNFRKINEQIRRKFGNSRTKEQMMRATLFSRTPSGIGNVRLINYKVKKTVKNIEKIRCGVFNIFV